MDEMRRVSVDLRKILNVAQLPALPQSAVRLLALSQDPENGPAEYAVPIEADAGLAGQVLRFVNSSYFGFSREISSVKLAITLVGVRTIKNFALWSAVFSLMPNPKCGPLDLRGLWQDSLRRALFARMTAKLLGCNETEEAFAAALLQDMAVPVLAKEAPQLYEKLLSARHEGQRRLSALEDSVFGWTHATAAGEMARQWNLPDQFAALVETHPYVERCSSMPQSDAPTLAVALSALLPSAVDPVWHERECFQDCYHEVARPGSPEVVELFRRTDEEFADFAPVLKVSVPRRSLVESLDEALAAAPV
jgi:HD-like signal output (HDOD) protein